MRRSTPLQEAVMQEPLPRLFSTGGQRVEGGSHQLVGAHGPHSTKPCEHLNLGHPFKQWLNQGLDRHHRAVRRACITPRLKVMGQGQMPLGLGEALVLGIAEADDLPGFADRF